MGTAPATASRIIPACASLPTLLRITPTTRELGEGGVLQAPIPLLLFAFNRHVHADEELRRGVRRLRRLPLEEMSRHLLDGRSKRAVRFTRLWRWTSVSLSARSWYIVVPPTRRRDGSERGIVAGLRGYGVPVEILEGPAAGLADELARRREPLDLRRVSGPR